MKLSAGVLSTNSELGLLHLRWFLILPWSSLLTRYHCQKLVRLSSRLTSSWGVFILVDFMYVFQLLKAIFNEFLSSKDKHWPGSGWCAQFRGPALNFVTAESENSKKSPESSYFPWGWCLNWCCQSCQRMMKGSSSHACVMFYMLRAFVGSNELLLCRLEFLCESLR